MNLDRHGSLWLEVILACNPARWGGTTNTTLTWLLYLIHGTSTKSIVLRKACKDIEGIQEVKKVKRVSFAQRDIEVPVIRIQPCLYIWGA